jgi:BirA family biotin operon repressor/biotin-[acetyl-CoA-carboxylase] ligase
VCTVSGRIAVVIDADRILAETVVRQVDFQRQLPSTNDRALALAAAGDVRLPLLVIAEQQTAGRGRGAHRWWSAEGALTFSLVWPWEHLAAGAESQSLLAIGAGLAACEACELLAPECRFGLKWPNDVLLAGRKLGGVLIEAPGRPLECVVIGVGVNVNNTFAAAPAELRPLATSLVDAAGHPFDLLSLLIGILQRLADHVEAIRRAPAGMLAQWRRRCVLTGQRVQLTAGTRRYTGTCRGIDDRGALLLETPTGTQRHVTGTITWAFTVGAATGCGG